MIDEVITNLEEVRDGRYTVRTFAPSEAGTYMVDVIMRNEFNIEAKEIGAAELKVRAKPELESAPEEERVIEEIGIR